MENTNIVRNSILIEFAQAELENKSEDIRWGVKQQAKNNKSDFNI